MMDILMLLGYLVAAGGTLLIATQVKTRVYASKPAFRNHTVTSGDYVIILMLTFLVIIVIDPLTNLFPVPDRYHDLFESLFSKSIPAFITAVILAPLLEELIFL